MSGKVKEITVDVTWTHQYKIDPSKYPEEIRNNPFAMAEHDQENGAFEEMVNSDKGEFYFEANED